MSEFLWNKPVLSLYRENNEQPESEAFAVIKAKKLTVSAAENGGFGCTFADFFCLMGDIDQIKPSRNMLFAGLTIPLKIFMLVLGVCQV